MLIAVRLLPERVMQLARNTRFFLLRDADQMLRQLRELRSPLFHFAIEMLFAPRSAPSAAEHALQRSGVAIVQADRVHLLSGRL